MGRGTEFWVALACGSLAAGLTAAVASEELHGVALMVACAVQAACAFAAGKLGTSRPSDADELESLRPPAPRASRHDR